MAMVFQFAKAAIIVILKKQVPVLNIKMIIL